MLQILLKEYPNVRHMKPSFELLSRAVQETLTMYSLLLLPLLALPVVRGKFLFRRHLALQNQGPVIPELELTWRPPPWRLVFMIQDTMQAFKGGKQGILLPICYTIFLFLNYILLYVYNSFFYHFLHFLKGRRSMCLCYILKYFILFFYFLRDVFQMIQNNMLKNHV